MSHAAARVLPVPGEAAHGPDNRDAAQPADAGVAGQASGGSGVSLEARLEATFGFSAFRPWQRDAVEAILEGAGRALVIAPTGGGKSLTYQFPATQLEGTTLVISPLVALMEDQVRGLRERGVEATWLSSTVPLDERREREAGLRAGRYQLVYVAPERLGNPSMMELLRQLRVPLLAVDEAHCISQWGHDFRPDYLRLGGLVQALAPPRILACTATATPVVREEIAERLGLADAPLILRGFARPNLHLEALPLDSSKARRRALEGAVREALGAPSAPKGAAIVYASTRKRTEQIAGQIGELGYRSAAYHAGLPADARAEVNAAFASGGLDVVVATNAFGMGIDRADIRTVVHAQAPGSIEAYYQEVGRAGRDGKLAHGLLLTSSADLGLRRRLIERSWDPAQRPAQSEIDRQWGLFLDLMRYVEAGSCRHDFILRYFGDEAELLGGCGHCDVCARLETEGEGAREVSDEDALVVRKALSGLARVRGQVGMTAIAKMLVGKKDAMLQRWRFDQLSTFGLLAEHDLEWVTALLRRLVTAGYALVSADDYPKPLLTSRGVAVMKGEEPVRCLPPPKSKPGRARRAERGASRMAPDEPELTSDEAERFERLRAVRSELAKERGVPAYVVCTDRTLREIARRAPRDEEELLACKGMGPARVESFGAALLAGIDG
ncbi:MAG: ATP-dependent DNA helicase RecQ [Myxococcota bacterium]